jgi:hypothetical protein
LEISARQLALGLVEGRDEHLPPAASRLGGTLDLDEPAALERADRLTERNLGGTGVWLSKDYCCLAGDLDRSLRDNEKGKQPPLPGAETAAQSLEELGDITYTLA